MGGCSGGHPSILSRPGEGHGLGSGRRVPGVSIRTSGEVSTTGAAMVSWTGLGSDWWPQITTARRVPTA